MTKDKLTVEEIEKCNRCVESFDSLGFAHYEVCGRKVKHCVEYKHGIAKIATKENVCGIHYNSIKKYCKKRNIELSETKIQHIKENFEK